MTDRRRINGPSGATTSPVFISTKVSSSKQDSSLNRNSKDLRKIYLKTGLTPSASGSAYLELEQSPITEALPGSLLFSASTLKLTCTVHGPRPLPRSSPFAPHISLSTHVKFAPFATERRRGYLRDAGERDLAVHLETALKGVILGDRWPKSGVEIIVTVLEGDEVRWFSKDIGASQKEKDAAAAMAMMSILSGCITVASAAIIDAGIDCIDLISGGLAAIISDRATTLDITNQVEMFKAYRDNEEVKIVLDPAPTEHTNILAVCVVGFLQSRDEITELWIKGELTCLGTSGKGEFQNLINSAIQVAMARRLVLVEAIRESAERKMAKATIEK